ncbi:MAG: MerR family transcriptional regulator [Nitriliruptoraceae bacterium]
MRAHTIGEVLNRLRDEFDDITISKIRLIESEGLITPDRTESGYRKFTDADIERLRYILRAQRDRGQPLTRIRDELDRLDIGDHEAAPAAEVPEGDDAVPIQPSLAFDESVDFDLPDVQLTTSELADAAGLRVADVVALCEHGLIPERDMFDATALRIARIAAQLMDGGLEPRHLRMYRQFAERESALIGQLVGPLLRQRNPESHKRASDQSEVLRGLGGQLHQALLIEELRTLLSA